MRWRRYQTSALQTCTCLTFDVLETTINQLTTTSSQVVYQSLLDHSIISGSNIINSCWCRLISTRTSLTTVNRLHEWTRRNATTMVLVDKNATCLDSYRQIFLFLYHLVYVFFRWIQRSAVVITCLFFCLPSFVMWVYCDKYSPAMRVRPREAWYVFD